MTPNAYWSVAGVTSSARHCSGGINSGVPINTPELVIARDAVSSLAIPKSTR